MARKWRPKNFEDMVGQDHIAQTIRNAIDGKRISHAYLFTGTRGVGKTTSARILAKALNCKNGPTPIPCDACENCKAVNNGNSLDVLEIDGASNNSVDDIRDLREQVNYAPMNGTYKIYVIDEVHMLSKNAFNALLKTLEEPPAHVVFIFATTEVNRVPHTILSRVQRFDFKRISEQNIRERLEYICAQESIKPEREALEAVARKADGSMRDALSLFDQVYAFSGADFSMEAARKVLGLPRDGLFDGILRALVSHDQKGCFLALQEAHSEGTETQDLLIAFGEYLRNMLFARQGVSPGALGLSEGRYADLINLAPELRDGDLIRFAKMVSDILAALKNAANPRLAVELGFARMAALDRVVTLSQVLGAPTVATQPGSPAAPPMASRPAEPDLSEVKKKSPVEPVSQAPAAPVAVSPSLAPRSAPSAHRPEPDSAAARADSVPDLTVQSRHDTEAGQAAAEFSSAVATLAEPAVAEVRESGPATGAPLPETEPDMDREPELDYPSDPEESDAAVAAPSPARSAEPESLVVAKQSAPALLPALWPALIAEFMTERPLLGSHLLATRLEWESGETSGLRLVFQERGAWALIGDDGDFRKSIQAFLAGKAEGGKEIAVRFSLDEAAAAKAKGAEPVAVAFERDPLKREPILKYIQDLFEGRML